MKRATLLLFLAGITLAFSLPEPARSTQFEIGELYELNRLQEADNSPNGQALYESSKNLTSEIIESSHVFHLISAEWKEEVQGTSTAHISIRTRSLDGEWSDWKELHEDEDGPVSNTTSSYLLTDESNAFQYQIELSSLDSSYTPQLSDLTFNTVNGGEPSELNQVKTQLGKLVFKEDADDIIKRSEWGANESYRLASNFKNITTTSVPETDDDEWYPDMEIKNTVYEDDRGRDLWWPQDYSAQVKKIIIHHTATTKDLDKPESAVRAIYQYHALSRAWGDIGYNYVIDPEGNIYEGRAGGPGVVGAHTAKFNTGSIGIALLGNYEDAPISGEMMQSLMGLIQELADEYDIEVDSKDVFRGERIENLLGHKDLQSTACPGEVTYDYLPQLRDIIADSLKSNREKSSDSKYSFDETSDRELLLLEPDSEEKVKITLKNTGSTTWNSAYLTIKAYDDADDLASFDRDANRAIAQMKQSSVSKGRVATFEFDVEAGDKAGLGHFVITPVLNGKTSDQLVDLAVYLSEGTLDFSVKGEDAPSSLDKGEEAEVVVSLKNTGSLTWKNRGDNKVILKQVGSSKLSSKSTLASLEETSVSPGEVGTFIFDIDAPNTSGRHKLKYQLEMPERDLDTSKTGSFTVSVGSSSSSSSSSTRSSSSSSDGEAVVLDSSSFENFTADETRLMWIQLKNESRQTWKRESLYLDVGGFSGIKATKARSSLKSVVPGQSTKLFFSLTMPSEEGKFKLTISPKHLGKKLLDEALEYSIEIGEETTVSSVDYDKPVRIALTPNNDLTSPIILSDSKFTMFEKGESIHTFSSKDRVRLTPSGSNFKVSSGRNSWTLSAPIIFQPEDGAESVMTISNFEQRPAWNTTLNDNAFRGNLEVHRISGKTVLVNELPIEYYIRGIGEVSNGDPVEKIRTIMVLARSYAAWYTSEEEKFPGMPYDIDDSPERSQKYLGYNFETRANDILDAAIDTEGKVVTFRGELVKTPYFSSTDGTRTRSAQSVWGWTHTPYLVSVSDEQCEAKAFAGHGVGLSGCGATALARQGKSYEEIIKYYFKGVEIDTL